MAVKSWRAVMPAFPARRTAMWMPPLLIVCAPRYLVMAAAAASTLPEPLHPRVRSLIIENPFAADAHTAYPFPNRSLPAGLLPGHGASRAAGGQGGCSLRTCH